MGEHLLQVGEQRGGHAGSVELAGDERGHGDALLQERAACDDVPVGRHRDRPPGEELAPLRARELRDDDEHAVLDRHRGRQRVPALQVGGPAAPGRREVPSGRSAHHDEELRAAHREDGARQRVPRLLADQHAHPPEPRVEGPKLRPRLHEASLVEDPVRGEEHLAVDVADTPPLGPGLEVGDAVVEPSPPALVEADDDVRRVRGRAPERLGQPLDGQRRFRDPSLEEVPREGGFGKHEEVDAVGIVGNELPDPVDVSPDVGLHGLQLRQADPQGRLRLASIHERPRRVGLARARSGTGKRPKDRPSPPTVQAIWRDPGLAPSLQGTSTRVPVLDTRDPLET